MINFFFIYLAMMSSPLPELIVMGNFRFSFCQQDLLPEDVFILDTYENVFVWVGNDARHEEKIMAMDAALVRYSTS